MNEWLARLIAYMEEDHDGWTPVAVVELEQTEDREPCYKDYPHCRIKGDESRRLYLRMDREEPFGHYYVWQTTGYMGDDYSGWLLFPLPEDGKYLQVSYSC